ncbi:D-Ala-D-Ala carboxypeptidase family metallohydrolase [Myxococcaceae bacterium GXIMD 01537]
MKRTRWWAWALCLGLAAGCDCGEPGTGGSGTLPQDEEQVEGREVTLAVTEVHTEGADAQRTSFIAPGDTVKVTAQLTNVPVEQAAAIHWTVTPVGTYTGPAVPAEAQGPELVFKGTSALGTGASREASPPLEYEVVATAQVEGKTLEARLPPSTFIRQDERDSIRQEYFDFGATFEPTLAQVVVAGSPRFNTGNYTLIVEETSGGLEDLLRRMNEEANRILNDDVQEKRVGTTGLRSDTVVVSPGPGVLGAGPLGDTDPQGDDTCGGPLVGGACAGPILAGRNGVADTTANNRATNVNLEDFITSAFRNPRRNAAVGSSIGSRHTRGNALDIDPRSLVIKGKDARGLMCVVEAAGDRVVGERNSFTEQGAKTFLDCNDPAADHVHIQR